MIESLLISLIVHIFSSEAGNSFIAAYATGEYIDRASARPNFIMASFKKIALGKEAEAVISEIERARNQIDEQARLPESPDHFPVKTNTAKIFTPTANGAYAMDGYNEDQLFEKNADQVWPLASITKLVTAMVFLENNPGWESIYEVKKDDRREGGKIFLFSGEKVKVKDLFYVSLVGSGNTETISLVRSTGLSEADFIKKMNEKAKSLGLEKTYFSDPAGLDDNSVSTAKETAKIIKAALANEDIAKASLTKKHEFKTLQGKEKIIFSTDELLAMNLSENIRVLGGKTGHTDKAGFSFAGKFSNKQGDQIISVILGGSDNDSRFLETHDMVDWVFKNYRWR